MDERVELAGVLYERAIFGIADGPAQPGSQEGLTGADGKLDASVQADRRLDALARADRELDAAEAELVLARGKVMHGRFLEDRVENPAELPSFERAVSLLKALGDERGEAEALFWIGCFHQVVRDDNATAKPVLVRSRDLATKTGDKLTLSYALRHLGVAEQVAGHLDAARELLEASTSLRRELGFLPGVAANLVGLIYIASAQNRTADAEALADKAAALAESCRAGKIFDQVTAARARL
jgi:tetratricopeptide (TPR) repeat protein